MFKFNRDLERHTLRSDDLGTAVFADESLKEELRQEKQQGVCLREQLKMLESEGMRMRDAVGDREGKREELGRDRAEMQ